MNNIDPNIMAQSSPKRFFLNLLGNDCVFAHNKSQILVQIAAKREKLYLLACVGQLMLKLPEPGLHRVFLRFGFLAAITLPLICKALLSFGLLVKRI